MRTSGVRVASRDIREAASATTSTRPTKGRATRREATSSRTRRRSSYTQTLVAPCPGPRILSSITACSSLSPAHEPPGSDRPGNTRPAVQWLGLPRTGEPPPLHRSWGGSGFLPLPVPLRPVPSLIDTIGLQHPPSPPGVRSAISQLEAKSCDHDVFGHVRARAPGASAAGQPPPARDEPWRRDG